MAQTRRTKKRNPLQAVLLIALVLIAVVALVLTLGKGRKPSAEVTAIQEGLDFLSQQEEKDPDTVRQARQALYVRRMEAQKDELIEKLDSGDILLLLILIFLFFTRCFILSKIIRIVF